MARRATIQLKVHRQLVQSIPLDDADIECLIQGLRLVTPCTGLDGPNDRGGQPHAMRNPSSPWKSALSRQG
jgi:hypothetical protein